MPTALPVAGAFPVRAHELLPVSGPAHLCAAPPAQPAFRASAEAEEVGLCRVVQEAGLAVTGARARRLVVLHAPTVAAPADEVADPCRIRDVPFS